MPRRARRPHETDTIDRSIVRTFQEPPSIYVRVTHIPDGDFAVYGTVPACREQ